MSQRITATSAVSGLTLLVETHVETGRQGGPRD